MVTRLFEELLGCEGRPFGRPHCGVSDGAEGVQWNAGYSQEDETAWLGVNLEGMKYDGWPIARLIEREMSRPLLLTKYRPLVARPEVIEVSWRQDVWQAGYRVDIEDARIRPTPITLDRLNDDGWALALARARECLNREYPGRPRTRVTPHLHFGTRFAQPSPHTLQQAKDNLNILYKFAICQARPFRGRRSGSP